MSFLVFAIFTFQEAYELLVCSLFSCVSRVMLPSWYSLLFPVTECPISTNSIPADRKVHAKKSCSCVESQDLFCALNVVKIIGKKSTREKKPRTETPVQSECFFPGGQW